MVGLEIGADDFVQKPIEPRVLLARIRALLRRKAPVEPATVSEQPVAKTLVFKQLHINLSARTVTLNGKAIAMTTPEFDVFKALATNAGTVISREALFMELKNLSYDGQNRFIDITISQIRKKLGAEADQYLKTVRGQGYLFLLE